jgi:hypothetical protein
MMTLLVEACIYAALILALCVRLFHKHPRPKYLGFAINFLCVVSAEEIIQYLEKLDQAEELAPHPHYERERRKQRCQTISGYLTGKMLNTANFQAIASFYLNKIDRAKAPEDYDEQEFLVSVLAVQTTEMRLSIFKLQVRLKVHQILAIPFDHVYVRELLGNYKSLEHDMAELSNMLEDGQYLKILMERLGITNWIIIPDQQISN